MWEVYVVFANRAICEGRSDCAGGINLVGDTVSALLRLLNPYNQNGYKILSIQRLRYAGRIQDIRMIRVERPIA